MFCRLQHSTHNRRAHTEQISLIHGDGARFLSSGTHLFNKSATKQRAVPPLQWTLQPLSVGAQWVPPPWSVVWARPVAAAALPPSLHLTTREPACTKSWKDFAREQQSCTPTTQMPTPPFQTVSTWPGNKKFTRLFYFPPKTDSKMGPIFGSTLNIILLGGLKNRTAGWSRFCSRNGHRWKKL